MHRARFPKSVERWLSLAVLAVGPAIAQEKQAVNGGELAHAETLIREANSPSDLQQGFELYQRLATAGNARAMARVGECYLRGTGTEKDIARALELLNKAAQQDEPEAMHSLGQCALNSVGSKKNRKQAFAWFEKGMVLGSEPCELAVASCYARGDGVARDSKKAIQMWERLAAKNSMNAIAALGDAYARGKGIKQNSDKGIVLLQQAAQLGSGAALNSLGIIYRDGAGVTADPARARELFEEGAKYGSPEAITNLGYYALRENHTSEAFRHFGRAAQLGDPSAMGQLGRMYYQGDGVTRNVETGLHWLELAVKADDTAALCVLGDHYWHISYPQPTDKRDAEKLQRQRQTNLNQGTSYFRKAVEQGDRKALNNLGYAYSVGLGTRRDLSTAFQWYMKAAKRGDEVGMCNVGLCYLLGNGVGQSRKLGIEWLQKSERAGYRPAGEALAELYRREQESLNAWVGIAQMLLDPNGGLSLSQEAQQDREQRERDYEVQRHIMRENEVDSLKRQLGDARDADDVEVIKRDIDRLGGE